MYFKCTTSNCLRFLVVLLKNPESNFVNLSVAFLVSYQCPAEKPGINFCKVEYGFSWLVINMFVCYLLLKDLEQLTCED